MPEQIIGSPDQRLLYVGPEGEIAISGVVGINGIIGTVPISGEYFPGSNVLLESLPTDNNLNNPEWSLVYDADGNLGSVFQMIGTGSFVNVITWEGFSGALPGIGSRVTNIGSWSAV